MFFNHKAKQPDENGDMIKNLADRAETARITFKRSMTAFVGNINSRKDADIYVYTHAAEILKQMSDAAMAYTRVIMDLRQKRTELTGFLSELDLQIQSLEDAYIQVFVIINPESPRSVRFYYTQAEIAALRYVPEKSVMKPAIPEELIQRLSDTYITGYLPDKKVLAQCGDNIPEFTPEQVLKSISFGDYVGQMISDNKKDRFTMDFSLSKQSRFTDNTILSVAVYEACRTIKRGHLSDQDAYELFQAFTRYYVMSFPETGYEPRLHAWVFHRSENYAAVTNDGTVRAGAIGACFSDVRDVIKYTVLLSYPTHFDKTGEQGAVFFAVCVWLALHGASKQEIRDYLYLKAEDIICMPGDLDQAPQKIFDLLLTPDDLSHLTEDPKAIYTTSGVRTLSQAMINFLDTKHVSDAIYNSLEYFCDAASVTAMGYCLAAIYYHDMTGMDLLFDQNPEEQDLLYETFKIHDYLKNLD